METMSRTSSGRFAPWRARAALLTSTTLISVSRCLTSSGLAERYALRSPTPEAWSSSISLLSAVKSSSHRGMGECSKRVRYLSSLWARALSKAFLRDMSWTTERSKTLRPAASWRAETLRSAHTVWPSLWMYLFSMENESSSPADIFRLSSELDSRSSGWVIESKLMACSSSIE